MKTKAYFSILAAMLLGAAFAQSTGTATKDNSEARLALIRNYLNAIRQREALPTVGDNMPGPQPSLESKLVPVLAQELLSQRAEIAALNKQIEALKEQKNR